ncbi:hypothetical protein [Undibacterium pigrum]|uniref:Uncharacterized protein n=1 Tax=Undibacterium pigrum TaxID=401470 RepID=A0A318J9K8_9BURK|nr:hypothetical protein [Undibacterium pigrum]PXX45032.1 hypothetical protein DFR42_102244 [Undibacterium pigrum]
MDTQTQNTLVTVEKETNRSDNMSSADNNPILAFVKNLADALKYVGRHAFNWVMQASWKKILLTSILTLITGGLLHLSSLANGLVFGAIIVKLFADKDSAATNPQTE